MNFVLFIVFHFYTLDRITETQLELEKSVKILVELLEEANIKVPHFVGPKLPNKISETVQDENKKSENETVNESTPKECKESQNNTKCKTNKTTEVTVKLVISNRLPHEKLQVNSPEKQNKNQQTQSQQQEQIQPQHTQHDTTKQKPQLNTLPELKEVQSFGSVDLIPVSNATKHDPKVHEKPVKNFVEITPLISSRNENISKKTENDIPDQLQPKVSTYVEGKITSLFIVLNFS